MPDSFIAQFVQYYAIGLHRLASMMHKYRKAIAGYIEYRQTIIPSYDQSAFIREIFFCYERMNRC